LQRSQRFRSWPSADDAGFTRGIYIGSLKDAHGNVFGAETNTRNLRKYVKK
jgi:hypothetical protein